MYAAVNLEFYGKISYGEPQTFMYICTENTPIECIFMLNFYTGGAGAIGLNPKFAVSPRMQQVAGLEINLNSLSKCCETLLKTSDAQAVQLLRRRIRTEFCACLSLCDLWASPCNAYELDENKANRRVAMISSHLAVHHSFRFFASIFT